MRSVLALVLLLVFDLVASAAPLVTPPPGWTRDPKSPATADVYLAPTPGMELVVSRSETKIGSEHQAEVARAALDDLHAMSKRAAMTGSGVTESGWQERSDATANTVEAMLSWRDPSSQLVETARLVLAADAQHIVGVTGECIGRDDTAQALRDACTAALATLDPGVQPRIALAIAPAGTPPPVMTATPPVVGPPPSMSEGHTPLAPISVPQETPTADRRPVFVGAGIVLLAGVFWWNMRRRARLERDEQDEDEKGRSDDR
jgi:hypothetical protein